jgi:hypothetical protein
MEVNGKLNAPTALPHGTYWIRVWVGPRAGPDAAKDKCILCVCVIWYWWPYTENRQSIFVLVHWNLCFTQGWNVTLFCSKMAYLMKNWYRIWNRSLDLVTAFVWNISYAECLTKCFNNMKNYACLHMLCVIIITCLPAVNELYCQWCMQNRKERLW